MSDQMSSSSTRVSLPGGGIEETRHTQTPTGANTLENQRAEMVSPQNTQSADFSNKLQTSSSASLNQRQVIVTPSPSLSPTPIPAPSSSPSPLLSTSPAPSPTPTPLPPPSPIPASSSSPPAPPSSAPSPASLSFSGPSPGPASFSSSLPDSPSPSPLPLLQPSLSPTSPPPSVSETQTLWNHQLHRNNNSTHGSKIGDRPHGYELEPTYGGKTKSQISRDFRLKELPKLISGTMKSFETKNNSAMFFPPSLIAAYTSYHQFFPEDTHRLPRLVLSDSEEDEVNYIIGEYIYNNPGISDEDLQQKVIDVLKDAYAEAGKKRLSESSFYAALVGVAKSCGIFSRDHALLVDRVCEKMNEIQKDREREGVPRLRGEELEERVAGLIGRLLRKDERKALKESLKSWKPG